MQALRTRPAAATPERRRLLTLSLSAAAAAATTLFSGCGTPLTAPATAPATAPGGAAGSTPGAATGSASVPDPAAAPPAAGAEPPAAPLETLETERRWLHSWFESTPVRVALQSDGVLAVDVPREFCFEAGSSRIRPPLAAVLDKVAESLRRRPQLRLDLLAAPADDGAAAVQALTRAQQLRQHLRSRGVPDNRLTTGTAASVAAVQLRMR